MTFWMLIACHCYINPWFNNYMAIKFNKYV